MSWTFETDVKFKISWWDNCGRAEISPEEKELLTEEGMKQALKMYSEGYTSGAIDCELEGSDITTWGEWSVDKNDTFTKGC